METYVRRANEKQQTSEGTIMKKLKVGRVFEQATGAMYLITDKLSDKVFIGKCIKSNFDEGKIMRFWFTGTPYFNGNESEIYYTGTNQYLQNVKAKTENTIAHTVVLIIRMVMPAVFILDGNMTNILMRNKAKGLL